MGFISDFRSALDKLQKTLHQFDADLTQLERIVDEHFTNGKITPKMMEAIEKELKP